MLTQPHRRRPPRSRRRPFAQILDFLPARSGERNRRSQISHDVFGGYIPLGIEGIVQPGDDCLLNLRAAEATRLRAEALDVELSRIAPPLLQVNLAHRPVLS